MNVTPTTTETKVSLLSQHYWLSLSKEIRGKLVALFAIPKTGESVVRYGPNGPEVQADGYTPLDLMLISTEKMQALLGTDSTDFYALLNDVIMNVDNLLDDTYLQEDEKIEEEVIKPKKKYAKKTKKNSKK